MKAMRNSEQKITIVMLMSLLWNFTAFAQISVDRLQQYISENRYKNNTAVKEFYEQFSYKTAWTRKENEADRNILFIALNHSADLGLSEKDYQYNYITSF